MPPVTRDTSQRRLQISELVRQHGSVQVTALAKRFGVSMQTVRKDLRYLEERGVMARAYGGAIDSNVVGHTATEPPYETKRTAHLDEKRRIGARAAALVQAGDTIAIDSGTTAIQLAEALPDIEITVVTNDFGVLSSLAPKSNINIVMLGGELRRKNMAFYGGLTVEALDALHVDKLFLGVDGLDLERGITTHYEPEAMLNRKMVEAARMVVAITDSSKFGKVCLHRIIPVSGLNALITDTGAPDDITSACQALGVEVVRA
ncbi:transcriptional repressor AgaR [Pseudoxanthomonas winnipegensis]|uniref:DeoR/GlpR transcriptional regulator n=1 Tax=Pseudoxanthomonas winnipegensis TaxID=2480810 RepID=A0A4Q8LR22_9GAMM|nr:transcriptional repressor AgaR [Pseudoxanthomonas winnipegensis]RZZ89199.1 DeoR/GlpR transcriptional regulator [Pseudoxanthomonas winnipegensis]TAA33351.1 DeoR/GlpR transcriptional regulator [Pseudoxanthomonas winnipegensis]TBV73325.1 DeoR/GlpR transcriptional regulator [Pseudoxanthomonas winnipegensis]